MTEAEWLVSTDPGPMLNFLRDKVSRRKARLFGCGYLRLIWNELEGKEPCRRAVEIADRFADNLVTFTALRRARREAEQEAQGWSDPAPDEPVWQAVSAAAEDDYDFLEVALWETTEEFAEPDIINPSTAERVRKRVEARHATWVHLLHDLFGNPFHPAPENDQWLAWREGIALQLARDIYDDPAFDRLPILADALEDAGCDNADMLAHCRGPGPHVRGCWVVDLILGKS